MNKEQKTRVLKQLEKRYKEIRSALVDLLCACEIYGAMFKPFLDPVIPKKVHEIQRKMSQIGHYIGVIGAACYDFYLFYSPSNNQFCAHSVKNIAGGTCIVANTDPKTLISQLMVIR